MRIIASIAALSLVFLPSMLAQGRPEIRSTQEEIKSLERRWASAAVRAAISEVSTYEADDVVFTDAEGHVSGKEQDLAALQSGDEKMQTIELRDVRVQVYDSTAIATGTNIMRWSQKGKDASGQYRFTDTWVKRNGRWRVVASQITKIQE